MGRNPCCDKEHVKRGPWTAEEDAVLKEYIEKHGGHGGSWTKFPKKAGLNRCGRSCRLRWINYLKPNLKLGRFSELDEITINYWVNLIGKKWSVIATLLPGRTDNDIKNYWKIKTRKEAAAASSSATQNENGNVLVNTSPQEPTFENVSNNAFYSDPGNQTFLQNHCPGDISVFNIPYNSFLSPPQHFPSNNYPVIHQPDCCNLNAVENYSCPDMVSGAVEDQELVGLSGGGWGQIPDKNNSCPEPMSGAVGVQELVGFSDRGWSQIPDELNMPGAFGAIENVGFNQLSDCKQSSLGIENNSGMDSIFQAAGDPSMLQPDFYYPNLIANNSGMNSMFVAAGDQEFLGFSGGWGTLYVGISKGGSHGHGLHDIQESSSGQFQCSNDKVFDTDAGSYGFSNMSVNATSLMPEFDWNKDGVSSLF